MSLVTNMVELKFKVQNLETILERYQEAPSIVSKELDTAMHKAVVKLKATAKIEAPVGANNVLRGAIYSKVYGGGYGIKGEVGVGPAAPYGVCVHEGTRPHFPPIAALKQWAERKLGNPALAYPIARHIAKVGTKANPFMQRAWDSEQDNITAFFEVANANIAKQVTKQ